MRCCGSFWSRVCNSTPRFPCRLVANRFTSATPPLRGGVQEVPRGICRAYDQDQGRAVAVSCPSEPRRRVTARGCHTQQQAVLGGEPLALGSQADDALGSVSYALL